MQVKYTVTNVKRPLVSASESANQGKTTGFGKDGGGLARAQDIEAITKGPYIPLKRVRGVRYGYLKAGKILGLFNAIRSVNETTPGAWVELRKNPKPPQRVASRS